MRRRSPTMRVILGVERMCSSSWYVFQFVVLRIGVRTESEVDDKVPPSPPETLVQGLGPLDSPLSIGFEAQCTIHVAMPCLMLLLGPF